MYEIHFLEIAPEASTTKFSGHLASELSASLCGGNSTVKASGPLATLCIMAQAGASKNDKVRQLSTVLYCFIFCFL